MIKILIRQNILIIRGVEKKHKIAQYQYRKKRKKN